MAILNRPLKQTLERCYRYKEDGFSAGFAYGLKSYKTSSGDVYDITVLCDWGDDYPYGVILPINLVLPSQKSYSIDELRDILGSALQVECFKMEDFDYYVYSVDAYIDGYSCTFTNETDSVWMNTNIDSPFTKVFIMPAY